MYHFNSNILEDGGVQPDAGGCKTPSCWEHEDVAVPDYHLILAQNYCEDTYLGDDACFGGHCGASGCSAAEFGACINAFLEGMERADGCGCSNCGCSDK